MGSMLIMCVPCSTEIRFLEFPFDKSQVPPIFKLICCCLEGVEFQISCASKKA